MLKSDVLGQSRRLTTVQHIYDRHTKFFMRSCFACKYPPGRQSAAPSTGPKVGDWWSPPCDTRSQVLDEAGKSYWPCFKWSRGINTSECPSVECRRHLKWKASLAERLNQEQINVACIQETHLNPNPTHRFRIRGYQTFRVDRKGKHKGGVLILVKNNIPATEILINTNQQAEIHGINVVVNNSKITIYNLYCPQYKNLYLQSMDLPPENCLFVGDFNSHSTCWGYEETDRRWEEVEDWQVEKQTPLKRPRRSTYLLLTQMEDPLYPWSCLCHWQLFQENHQKGAYPVGWQQSQANKTDCQLTVQTTELQDFSQVEL